VYVKVSEEDLRRMLLEELKKCSPCSFPELRSALEKKLGGPVDPRFARKVFAALVKEGMVRKEPRHEEKRFKFSA